MGLVGMLPYQAAVLGDEGAAGPFWSGCLCGQTMWGNVDPEAFKT